MCIFEYIYFARPDAIMEDVLVYEARLNMGRRLARTIRDSHSDLRIDCVIPVPDSARPAAMELAREYEAAGELEQAKRVYSALTLAPACRSDSTPRPCMERQ